LLKAVAGFIAPSEGEIACKVSGSRARSGPRGVPGVRPAAAVENREAERDVSAAGLANLTKKAEERALHYLEKVGLAAFADAYPHTCPAA
jgi:NitT/TauT family transport system ATP-binding protein